jgi:hypothetical protein
VLLGVVWSSLAVLPSVPPPAFNANDAVNAYDELNTDIDDVCEVNTTLAVKVLIDEVKVFNSIIDPVIVLILESKEDEIVVRFVTPESGILYN